MGSTCSLHIRPGANPTNSLRPRIPSSSLLRNLSTSSPSTPAPAAIVRLSLLYKLVSMGTQSPSILFRGAMFKERWKAKDDG